MYNFIELLCEGGNVFKVVDKASWKPAVKRGRPKKYPLLPDDNDLLEIMTAMTRIEIATKYNVPIPFLNNKISVMHRKILKGERKTD